MVTLPGLNINTNAVSTDGFNETEGEFVGTITSFAKRNETNDSIMYSYIIKVEGSDKAFSKIYNFTAKTKNANFVLADYITLCEQNEIKQVYDQNCAQLLKTLEGFKGSKVKFKQTITEKNGKTYTNINFVR